jgi:hypothetical protein
LKVVLRRRPKVRDSESPYDFEVAEIFSIDLIERRVARMAEIAAVGRPFAIGGAMLGACAACRRNEIGRRDEFEPAHRFT